MHRESRLKRGEEYPETLMRLVSCTHGCVTRHCRFGRMSQVQRFLNTDGALAELAEGEKITNPKLERAGQIAWFLQEQ
jgi:hypothetical protein